MNGTATLNEFWTVLTITGTYTRDVDDFDVNNSGFGDSVLQDQKGGKYVVQGGLGLGGDQLTCAATFKEWSFDVQARVDDVPAT